MTPQTVDAVHHANRNPGLEILIIGLLALAWIAGPLFMLAHAHQRRFFRACEHVYGITIDDPHVWEMHVDEVFRRNDLYWKLMLDRPDDPLLEVMRRRMLRLAVAGIWVLVIGFIVLFVLASAIGFD